MLVRRSFLPAATFDSSLDRLFRDAFDSVACDPSTLHLPVNVWEDEAAYHVEAELAGFPQKNVDITVHGDELRIEATVDEKSEEKDRGKLIRRERRTGKVARSLRFALDIEENDVKARFENGLLHVTLPKAKTALPRKIQIQ